MTSMTQADPARRLALSVNNIEVIYDHVILVLRGVSLDVAEGGIVALLGANGAGKTTTLKAISNLLSAERGEVTKGTIEYRGERVDRLTPNQLVRRGVCQVMEGRHCFAHLTVEENLLTGAFTRKGSRGDIAAALDRVYRYFPRLKELGASGLFPPVKTSCMDHEGSGMVKFQQWDGKEFKTLTPFMAGDRAMVHKMVEQGAEKYAAEKKITPRDCSKEM